MGPRGELRYLVLAAQREGSRILTEGLQPPGLATACAAWAYQGILPLLGFALGEWLVAYGDATAE